MGVYADDEFVTRYDARPRTCLSSCLFWSGMPWHDSVVQGWCHWQQSEKHKGIAQHLYNSNVHWEAPFSQTTPFERLQRQWVEHHHKDDRRYRITIWRHRAHMETTVPKSRCFWNRTRWNRLFRDFPKMLQKGQEENVERGGRVSQCAYLWPSTHEDAFDVQASGGRAWLWYPWWMKGIADEAWLWCDGRTELKKLIQEPDDFRIGKTTCKIEFWSRLSIFVYISRFIFTQRPKRIPASSF